MNKTTIICMLLSVFILSSCAIMTRTFTVQGNPGSEVSLQTTDSTYSITLDASGQGKIKWTNNSYLPTYFVSNTSSSLSIPSAIDYKIYSGAYGWGVAEFCTGVEAVICSGGLMVVSPILGTLTLGAGAYAIVDGMDRGFGSDAELGVRYLPFHTNDDMTFSMVPSRPSGEPKQKRTPGTKQTKRQAKTSSKKSSSKQESKATDNAFYHTVEQGEKLADIAKNYGVTIADIIRANKLKSNNIKAGQKLIIPM